MTCSCTCFACQRCEGKPHEARVAKLRVCDGDRAPRETRRVRVTFKALAGGEVRVAEYRGRKHVVVPVVALKEGVIFASNAETPEFVPGEELGKEPRGWNGRPVMMNHPKDENGVPVLANEPHVLEQTQIGQIFNSASDPVSLKMEAWLDPQMVEHVGDEARDLMARIDAGEIVDVSVGALVDTENKSGEWKGTRFMGIWRNIVPDHLAMLPKGVPGACSVGMGCGAPRAAAVVAGNKTEERASATGGRMLKKLKELRAAMLKAIRAAATPGDEPNPQADIDDDIAGPHGSGQSDNDLRMDLESQLYAVEPGFVGVHSVYQDASQVAYCVAPEGEPMYKMRSYAKDASGVVTLNDDAQDVELSAPKFVPKMSAAAPVAGAAAQENHTATEEAVTMSKQDLIKRILAAKNSPFAQDDLKTLEGLTECKLKALAERLDPAEAPATPPVAPPAAPVAPASTPESRRAAFLAENPDVAGLLQREAALRAARHAELLAALKDNGAYTEDELKAMSVDQLEKTAKLAGKTPKAASNVVPFDFSGNGLPRDASAGDTAPAPKITDQRDRIRAARGVAVSK